MSAEGIEPSTNGLKGRCSTIELRARFYKGGLHSNMGVNHSQRKIFFTAKTCTELVEATQSAQRKPFTSSRSLRSLR